MLGVFGVAAEGADRVIQHCTLTQPLQGCVDPPPCDSETLPVLVA